MIIDSIQNIGQYAHLNPRFLQVAEFLAAHKLEEMPNGHYEIDGLELFVNIVEAQPKKREDAKLETHDQMIDIQILLSGQEKHGYCPRGILPATSYDQSNDISFYDTAYDSIFAVHPGYAVIYFSEDAHAPAICEHPIRKAIFKVKK